MLSSTNTHQQSQCTDIRSKNYIHRNLSIYLILVNIQDTCHQLSCRSFCIKPWYIGGRVGARRKRTALIQSPVIHQKETGKNPAILQIILEASKFYEREDQAEFHVACWVHQQVDRCKRCQNIIDELFCVYCIIIALVRIGKRSNTDWKT